MPLVGLCLVAIGCGSAQDKRIAQLTHADVEQRRAAARALSEQTELDEPEIAALSQSVADSDVEVRLAAINALAKSGPKASSSVPALSAALRDSDPRTRVKAALAIGKIDPKNPSFVPVLADAMRGGDGRLLLEVGAMGEAAAWAVPTLVTLLTHQQAPMRALAAKTLGRIGPPAGKAKTALQRATHDSNAAVQQAAQQALARIQVPAKP